MFRTSGTILLASFCLVACNNTGGSSTASPADTVGEASLTGDTAARPAVATADNAQTSLDWSGTYEATLPCADCPGIKTIITLIRDNTFTLSGTYLEDNTSTVTEDRGTITWQDKGSVVHLQGKTTDILLKVGENRLFQLDRQGREIDGPLKEQYVYTQKQ